MKKETAAQYGMYVVSQLETDWLPYCNADLQLPAKLLPPADAKRITNSRHTGSIKLRGYLMEAGGTPPRLSMRDNASEYLIRLTSPGTVWFDGMQLEQGYEPTEFEK